MSKNTVASLFCSSGEQQIKAITVAYTDIVGYNKDNNNNTNAMITMMLLVVVRYPSELAWTIVLSQAHAHPHNNNILRFVLVGLESTYISCARIFAQGKFIQR